MQLACKETCNGTLEATPAGVVQIGPPLLFISRLYQPLRELHKHDPAGRPHDYHPYQLSGIDWVLPTTHSKPLCVPIGFFIIGFIGNVFAGGSIDIQLGKGSDSEQSEYAKNSKNGGPPAHAPAHGYRAKHQYRYYPSSSVYYDTGRGLYFYLKGDNWEVGASLPSSLRVGLGDSVSIELDTDRPYIHHAEHVKMYSRGN